MSCARRRTLTSRLICSVVAGFVLLGCLSAAGGSTNAGSATQVARLGRPFKLRAGQQITLRGEKLRIRFAAVEDDSRCPRDVTCIWAGNAAVRLDVSTSRRGSKSLTLNTGKNSSLASETEYQGYKLRLVELSPYPQSDKQIAAGDYIVTLLVTRE